MLDLLLADEDNPRSLAYQLAALSGEHRRLPRPGGDPGRDSEQRLILAALTRLRGADIDSLAEATDVGPPPLARLVPDLARGRPARSSPTR